MDLEVLFCEEIFLLMIPGIDMLSYLYLDIKEKHPFKADKFHIHLLCQILNKYVLLIILNLVFIQFC